MPAFNVEVPHQLGREEARQRLEHFVRKATEMYKDQVSDLKGEWSGDTLNFAITTYGFKISGALEVQDTLVRLSGTLPFVAMAFRGKIEKSFASELQRALN
jgi:putative polyhydroxyalkanoate system protein